MAEWLSIVPSLKSGDNRVQEPQHAKLATLRVSNRVSMKWSRQPPGLGPGHWGLRGWADGQRRALGAGPMAGQVPVTGFFLFAVANRFYASSV